MSWKENAQKLKEKLNREKAIWDGIDDRVKKAKDASADAKALEEAEKPTADEAAELKTLQTEINELDAKCAESKEYEDARQKNEAKRAALGEPVGRPEYGDASQQQSQIIDAAKQFLENAEFKDWFKRVAPSGYLPDSVRIGDSPGIEIPFSLKSLFKSIVTGVSLGRLTGSGMVRPDYQGVVPFFQRPLTLRDVVTVGRTSSDLVEFTRITSFTNNAAPTAEATTGALDSSSGLKPESALTTEIVKESVRSIPHWIPITRRALSDAPQMEGYINDLLMDGVEIKLEDQMITGTGAGENLLGLDNTPGITLQGFDTDILTTTRKARTLVRTRGRARATAFLMHPNDWEAFDLLTNDTQGNFYFGGPMALGNPRLWGLPVIESEAVLEGTFYTGDLKQAVLWDRERANIRVSDSPDNYFLRNIVAILCELRAAFGVLRPAAIVRGDLHAGANS